MRLFVTGVGGQLGHDVMNELLKRGHEGIGSDIQENYSGVADCSAVTKAPYVALDITDKDAVEKVIAEVNPDAVIHCAAWTAVDMAEDDDKVAKVRAINAGGTQNIADVCKKLDCKMTYISTDYVFDGQGTVALAAGLQGLQASKCVRPDEIGRGAGSQPDAGEVFYCPHCMGVWSEW